MFRQRVTQQLEENVSVLSLRPEPKAPAVDVVGHAGRRASGGLWLALWDGLSPPR
jgi:hypothetical protein